MGENKNPNQNQNQNIGQNPNQNPNPSKDRESATQPGKKFPGEQQDPSKERAGNPTQDRDDDAAKRQQRQDPLQQNKDRDR